MANWLQTIDLRDVWESEDIPLIARKAAAQLRGLARTPTDDYLDEERLDFAEEFEALEKEDQ